MRRRRPLIILAVLGLLGAGVGLVGARAWRSTTPDLVEFAMPEARDTPTAVAASADGTIWFTIDLAAAVGRIRDGQLERIAKEAASLEPIGIAADAGGGAWFTDVVAGAISHVSVDGTVTSVPINTPIVRLGRVAAAPDGGVWFAESSLQSVTLLKDGVLFRHPTGVPDGGPYGVAVGGDGTVWATLQAGNALVRIAPSREVQVLELPRPGAVPTDIAVAPDGSVWFIEFRANRIVRYREGAFEGFAVPGANAGLSGLAVAPDGTVWFGMLREGSLGRLSGGRLQRLRLPRERARPYSVAVDAIGNIWYADITGHVGMVPSDTP